MHMLKTRGNQYIYRHFGKSKNWLFCQKLSASVWILLKFQKKNKIEVPSVNISDITDNSGYINHPSHKFGKNKYSTTCPLPLFDLNPLFISETCNLSYNWNPLYLQRCGIKLLVVNSHNTLYWFLCHYLLQCCGSGSGIRCFFDPWIRDEYPGSYFRA